MVKPLKPLNEKSNFGHGLGKLKKLDEHTADETEEIMDINNKVIGTKKIRVTKRVNKLFIKNRIWDSTNSFHYENKEVSEIDLKDTSKRYEVISDRILFEDL